MDARHPFFKRRVLDALRVIATPALSFKYPTIEDFAGDEVPPLHELVSRLQNTVEPILPDGLHKNTAERAMTAAMQVALCYIIGVGTDIDMVAAMEWLVVASLRGIVPAILLFSVLEDALGSPRIVTRDLPRCLWLLTGAVFGSAELARILKDQHSHLYSGAMELARSRGGLLRLTSDPDAKVRQVLGRVLRDRLHIDHAFPPMGYTALHYAAASGVAALVALFVDDAGATIDALTWGQETSLNLAVNFGHHEIADFLLDRGADPSFGDPFGNMTPLHNLAYCDDEPAAFLAEKIIGRGASLDLVSVQRTAIGLESPFMLPVGTPLRWAARKRKQELFMRLLHLHEAHRVFLPDLDSILEDLAIGHQASMLANLIPKVKVLRSNGLAPEQHELDMLLCSTVNQPLSISHRFSHRQGFREAQMDTIKVLLDVGADPHNESGELRDDSGELQTALSATIYTNSLGPLKLFITYLEQNRRDVKSILQSTLYFGGRNALQRSMYCHAWEVFEYLLDTEYVDLGYSSEQGITALHATIHDDPRFVEALVAKGCDVYQRSKDGRSPFTLAVCFGNFKAADCLLQHTDDKEKLFFEPNSRGFMVFGSTISAAITNYRHVIDMRAILYLHAVGASCFIVDTVNRSCLHLLAAYYAPTRPDYLAFDRALLEFILDTFPESSQVNAYDDLGLTALHWMVVRANFEGVYTILRRYPTCINIETAGAGDGGCKRGLTALNLAMARRHTLPNYVRAGGDREIRKWRKRVENIITLLRDSGGILGSGADLFEQVEAAGMAHTTVVYRPDWKENPLKHLLGYEDWADADARLGAWPKRLTQQAAPHHEGVTGVQD